MSANAEKLFTFIAEKQGSTCVEQFHGHDVHEATLRWFQESQIRPGKPRIGSEPVAVSGVTGVWCTGGIDPEDVFFLVNIVATLSQD